MRKQKKRSQPVCCRRVISALLVLLLFFAVLGATCAQLAYRLLCEDGLEHLPVRMQLSQTVLQITDDGGERTLAGVVYDLCQRTPLAGQVTQADIEQILEEPLVHSFFEFAVEEYRAYLIDGREDAGLTADRILEFLSWHEADVQQAFQRAGVPVAYEVFRGVLQQELQARLGDTLAAKTLFGDAPVRKLATQMRNLLPVTVAFWCIALLVMGLLFAVNRAHLRSVLLFCAWPFCAVGAVYLVAVPVVRKLLGAYGSQPVSLAADLVRAACLPVGWFCLLSGMALLLIAGIWNLVTEHRRDPKADAGIS